MSITTEKIQHILQRILPLSDDQKKEKRERNSLHTRLKKKEKRKHKKVNFRWLTACKTQTTCNFIYHKI